MRGKQDKTVFDIRKAQMTPVIEQIYNENDQIFGPGKIHAILKDRGYAISEKTVADIMHKNGWFSIRTGAKKQYLQQEERRKNILNQQFKVSRPNEVWVSDITYFRYNGMMYYICVILDLFARKVVAYKIYQPKTAHSLPKEHSRLRMNTGSQLICFFTVIRAQIILRELSPNICES